MHLKRSYDEFRAFGVTCRVRQTNRVHSNRSENICVRLHCENREGALLCGGSSSEHSTVATESTVKIVNECEGFVC